MAITSESTFADFELLREPQVVVDNSSIGKANECSFSIPAFAYPTDTTDTYRNDFAAPLLALSNRFENPNFFLDKKQPDCSFLQVAQLNDSTLGELTSFSNGWLGYKLEWHLVESNHGVGCYRIRGEYDELGNPNVLQEISYQYDLKVFTDGLADKTIKFTYDITGGKVGSTTDDKAVLDYGTIIWCREFRVRGFFGFETSEINQEFVKYKNGSQNWTASDQIEQFLCYINSIPYSLHREIKINALQADNIFISDYNIDNQAVYDHKQVITNSNYEPIWARAATYAPVSLSFIPFFQNFERKRQ